MTDDKTLQRMKVLHIYQILHPQLVDDFKMIAMARQFGWKDTDSGLRTRRKELERLGIIKRVDKFGVSPSGNACWRYCLTPESEQ